MGRAFLSNAYLTPAPAPRKVPGSLERWSTRNFDPDQEEICGHAMVYEAVVDPSASLTVPESAVRSTTSVVTSAAADDASSSDGDSDEGTTLSSPSSVTSNEAQQLASLQRRLFGEGSGSAGSGSPTAAVSPTSPPSETTRRIQDHIATISSIFDRVAPPNGTGRGPRRAATLSALDIVSRPAVAQPI